MQQSLPDSFNGLCDMITHYNRIWEKYVLQDTSGSLVDLPCGYGVSESVTLFEKLLLLKIFKPEKLMFAFQAYVRAEIGQLYSESPLATMDALFTNSNCQTPIIFVLS